MAVKKEDWNNKNIRGKFKDYGNKNLMPTDSKNEVSKNNF